jgi:hypothetical protein
MADQNVASLRRYLRRLQRAGQTFNADVSDGSAAGEQEANAASEGGRALGKKYAIVPVCTALADERTLEVCARFSCECVGSCEQSV